MVRTGEWISKGWEMVTKGPNLGMFIVLGLILAVVMGFLGAISKGLVSVILAGPAWVAAYLVVFDLLKTGKMDLNRLSDIGPLFVQAMVAGIIIGFLTGLGFILLVIPGVIVCALFLFTYPLIADRNMSFGDAMNASREKVQQDLGGFIVLALALIGINILGAIPAGLGLLVTIPVTLCAVAIAYRELWSDQPQTIVHDAPTAPPPPPAPSA